MWRKDHRMLRDCWMTWMRSSTLAAIASTSARERKEVDVKGSGGDGCFCLCLCTCLSVSAVDLSPSVRLSVLSV